MTGNSCHSMAQRGCWRMEEWGFCPSSPFLAKVSFWGEKGDRSHLLKDSPVGDLEELHRLEIPAAASQRFPWLTSLLACWPLN